MLDKQSRVLPAPLSPADYRSLIKSKGWRIADLAFRWEIRAETLSRIISDEGRPRRWDDLVRGLPRLNRLERKLATEARIAACPPRKRGRSQIPPTEYPVGTNRQGIPKSTESHREICERSGNTLRGLRYQGFLTEGDELLVNADMDAGFADEGDRLYVMETQVQVLPTGPREDYLVENAATGACVWITPDVIDEFATATGRIRGV